MRSASDYIVLFVGGLICVGGVCAVPVIWRDASPPPIARQPLVVMFGEQMWRGTRRAFVPVLLVIIGMYGIYASEKLGVRDPRLLLRGSLLALTLLGVLLWFTVVVLNRPGFLVPPSVRHEPGALWASTKRSAAPDEETCDKRATPSDEG